MKYLYIVFILFLVVPLLGESSYAIMETKHGQVLYSKDMNKKRPMASTTKIMTAIVFLENGNKKNITYTKEAFQIPTKNIFFKAGSVLSYENALMGMMIASSNDLAYSIAQSLNYNHFINLMNNKAKSLGMNNTHFINPNGLDHKDHYSTAYDLCLLGKYSMKNKEFTNLLKPYYTVTAWNNNKKTQQKINSTFKEFYTYPELRGIKTGTTTGAKHCFVGYFNLKDISIVTCVLGSDNALKETKNLVDYVKENCVFKKVLDKNYTLIIKGEKVPVKTEKIELFCDKNTTINKKFITYTNFPIKKGNIVGVAKIYSNNKLIKKENLISQKTIIATKNDICITIILLVILCSVIYYFKDFLKELFIN